MGDDLEDEADAPRRCLRSSPLGEPAKGAVQKTPSRSAERRAWFEARLAGEHANISTVRCGGAQHRIRLSKRGSITLLDHTYSEAERALAALAGEDQVCPELLRHIQSARKTFAWYAKANWLARRFNQASPALRAVLWRAIDLRMARPRKAGTRC